MDTLRLDVLIIGAGQAGLAAGRAIQRMGRPLDILLVDQNKRVGDSWRNRYQSLVLFTPRSYSALPGMTLPGDPDGFPTKDEVANYLEGYARHFELPIRMLTEICNLEKRQDGFLAETQDGLRIESSAVILANGAFQKPYLPSISADFSPFVIQFNSATYRSPASLPPGTILVVGDGATGRQIALELADRQPAVLAAGSRRKAQPQRFLGKGFFWWADHLGLLNMPITTPIGQYLLHGDTFPGQHISLGWLRKRGVRVEDRLVQVSGHTVRFKNGTTADVSGVIWATGYVEDNSMINIEYGKDQGGKLIHYRGVSPVPGLFILGRNWQWTGSSALLHGVGRDAGFIAHVLDFYLDDLHKQAASFREATGAA